MNNIFEIIDLLHNILDVIINEKNENGFIINNKIYYKNILCNNAILRNDKLNNILNFRRINKTANTVFNNKINIKHILPSSNRCSICDIPIINKYSTQNQCIKYCNSIICKLKILMITKKKENYI